MLCRCVLRVWNACLSPVPALSHSYNEVLTLTTRCLARHIRNVRTVNVRRVQAVTGNYQTISPHTLNWKTRVSSSYFFPRMPGASHSPVVQPQDGHINPSLPAGCRAILAASSVRTPVRITLTFTLLHHSNPQRHFVSYSYSGQTEE